MSSRCRRDFHSASENGVALVVVLWVILVLSLLIGGFAFRMQVETQIASFSRKQLKAETLARSGVEVARMQLLLHVRSSGGGFDALNQEWATNETLYVDHVLGEGQYNVQVTAEDGKMPVNQARAEQWHQLLELLDIETSDADVIVDSILDWIDEGDFHRLNGAETDYYESLSPPYRSKNGPVDRVEELLLVRGVTPELFDGFPGSETEEPRPGLGELVTTTTSGRVNVNAAPPLVLRAWFGLDALQLETILNRRNGEDGELGTEDDQPFRSVDEFSALIVGRNQRAIAALRRLGSVGSAYFRVVSTGQVGNVRSTVTALLRRRGAEISIMAWQQEQGGG